MTTDTTPAVPPEAIAAARNVLWGSTGFSPSYMARAAEYVSMDSTGAERDTEYAALEAADIEADRKNDELVRRALEAAAPFMAGAGQVAVSREDIRAVVRLARMSRHLSEDPATDRLAKAAGEGDRT